MHRNSAFARNRRTPRGTYGGVKGLLQWVRAEHPAAYRALEKSRPELLRADGLAGLGDAASVVTNVTDQANKIAAAVLPFLQLNAQRKLLNAQVTRAKQGLPPLDVSQVQLPAARVEVDAGANIGKYARWAGIAGLGLLAYFVLRGSMRAQR